jgi:cell division protein FtsB
MFDFYEKRKIRDLLFSRVTTLIVCMLALFLAMSAYSRYSALHETSQKRVDRATELARLNDKVTELNEKVVWLESDRGIEGALREQLDVAKEGEDVVVIVPPHTASDTETGPERFPLPKKPSLLERLKFW